MRKTAISIIVMLLPAMLMGQSARQKVTEGNQLFAEEKYDEANNKYRDALLDEPDKPEILFNIGNIQYKKKKYEEAIAEFEKTTVTDDIIMQAKAYYNIGNTLYKMDKLPESILAYTQALKLNPDDQDAKYNIEFVRRKLKDQPKDQQQQDQQQQDQDQEKIEPSENAKRLKERAEMLVRQRKYTEAQQVMTDGMQMDETVRAFQDFIDRIKDIVDIAE